MAHPNEMVIGMVDVAESEGTSLSHGHSRRLTQAAMLWLPMEPRVALLDCREYGW